MYVWNFYLSYFSNFTKKEGFQFWESTGVEQCDDKQKSSGSVRKAFVYRHTAQMENPFS